MEDTGDLGLRPGRCHLQLGLGFRVYPQKATPDLGKSPFCKQSSPLVQSFGLRACAERSVALEASHLGVQFLSF